MEVLDYQPFPTRTPQEMTDARDAVVAQLRTLARGQSLFVTEKEVGGKRRVSPGGLHSLIHYRLRDLSPRPQVHVRRVTREGQPGYAVWLDGVS